MTDLELVHRACAHDAVAWRTLYERYLPMVWRRAYALVGCTHAAEDLTSEVMVALVRNLQRIRQELPAIPELENFVSFIAQSQRGICR